MSNEGPSSPEKLLRSVVARPLRRKPFFAGGLLWCLIAAAVSLTLAGCNSGGDGGTAAESKPAPKTLIPPAGFSATADEFIVRLSWSADPASAKIEGYEITRNGHPLATPVASLTSYADFDVRVGKQYTYEIRSKGVSATSDWVSDEVTIKAPPLAEARLEGDFGATEKVIAFSGYDTFKHNFAWHFAPKCRHGACDVVWRASNYDSGHALLKQEGKTYTGTYHGFFNGHCGETRSTSTVDFTLKVLKAKAIDGEWRATKLRGTVGQSEAAQFGCVASQGSVSINASLRIPD